MMRKKILALSLALLLVLLLLVAIGGMRVLRHPPAHEPELIPEPTSVPVLTPEPVSMPEPAPTPEPTPTPNPAIELPPLPDVDITSWKFLYAGPHLGVKTYAPKLQNFEGQYLDVRCADAADAFLAAARAEGFEVYVCSSYFPWEYRLTWYENAIREYGSSYEAAKHVFAFGCSDHNTGLAFDITDESHYWAEGNYNNLHDETVADTGVCKWMDAHCAEYGFIVRYPESRREVYGMSCYPGHYRYVGKEAARYIMDNGLCLEEFLALYGVTIRGVNYVNEYSVKSA